MKRDMDLCRKLLFYVEEHYEAGCSFIDIKMDDYTNEVLREHCKLLNESGFLNSAPQKGVPISLCCPVCNLTNAGYDFLDKIRQDTIWNNTKEAIVKKGLPLIPKMIEKVADAVISSAAEGITTGCLKQNGIGGTPQ